MKRVGKVLLFVILSPLVVLIVVIGLPIAVCATLADHISLRRFRKKEAGSLYLICTPRRGWYDYLQNNVFPVLPCRVTRVVWHRPSRGKKIPRIVLQLQRSQIAFPRLPYLVAVFRNQMKAVSIHNDLLTMKQHPKRSEHIKSQSRGIVERRIEALLKNP